MWSYIIDGALILILLICLFVGIAKGFFDSLLSLIGTGIALVASVFLAKHVAGFINNIFKFEDFILGKIKDIPEVKENGVLNIFNISLKPEDVAKFCVWICSVIIVFLIIKLAIYILSKIFDSVTKNSPTITGINRLLGMVFGLAKGGVIVIVLLALCSLLCQVPVIGKPIYKEISNTTITSKVFNFVDDFVEKNLTEDTIKDIIEKIKSETSNNDSKDSDTSTDTGSDSGNSDNKLEVAPNYYIEYKDTIIENI